ncbi:MAG: hypothetical protein KY443_07890 [Actinobacteria bacterium]|nr:hypothetical protein [Actinomycetota bacterium]
MRLRHLLVGVVLAAMVVVGAPAPASTAEVDPQAAESAFVARINALRASKGLGTLEVDGELTAIARRWAARMAAVGNISHNRNLQNEVTADWAKLGENVGMGPQIDKLHRAFVASPTHYKNLVDGDFTRVGVGVVVTADGTIFTAHQFERLASDNAVVVTTAAPSAPAHAVAVLDQLRHFDRPAA